MGETYSIHIVIRGRVQGVGFRYWLAGEAEERKLSGWVCNRRDGAVEAVFAGDEALVKDMIAACSLGPRFADVQDIEVLNQPVEAGNGFEIRPTI
ncbi:MAG: acylphosphatase [Rhizobiales bacterium]|nr:acylphosphatase [Hyphomicrobiales bacterium]